MFRNFLKSAWRNIKRSKGYSALNISGLATGMAVALLIGLWVNNEYSYDKFLPDYSRLYQVRRNFNSNGEILTFSTTSLKLADALRTQIPDIEYVAESDWMDSHGLSVGEKKLYIKGARINGDFLKMFQYPLLEGDVNTAMNDPYSIVLSRSTSIALFGTEHPIGKTVRFENKNDLKVTAILKDVPANSTLQFSYLVPFSYLEQTSAGVKENRAGSFHDNSYQIFTKLKPGSTYEQVALKIKDIEKTETTSQNAMLSDVIMQPLSEWHLYSDYTNGKASGGLIEYVKMFSIIGMLVLLIACINFINLTTARSEKRAREVGVRKAIGSRRQDLILQFLGESFLLTLIASLFALLVVFLALPFFNSLTNREIRIPYDSIIFWLTFLGCVSATALFAGSRPAFYLSSFNAVKVLKGTIHDGKTATWPRKMLVVAQFTCSIALIISTLIIYKQIQYAQNRPKGYELNRLMVTNMNDDLNLNYNALKNELLQKRVAESVTTSSSPATGIYWHSDVERWPGKNEGETIEMGTILVGEDYFKTLGIQFLSGRNFTSVYDTTSVIFNEAAIRQMRIKNPLNQVISWQGTQFYIAGITKDVLMSSPYAAAEPTMFFCRPGTQGNLVYRLSPQMKTADAIAQLTGIFNKYNPSFPYDYKFADAEYANKFNLEVLVGRLAALFTGLAIFISCLGLFGLAAYIAEQRTREIGIRKVLGATVSQVWVLLSKDFITLVFISCLIASPLAFYFLQGWLEKYSYRIDIGAGVFLLAAAMAIIITIITISFQAIRAALANPVKSLRTE